MKRLIVMLTGLALVTACATATPYQSAVGSRWGFEENQIEADRFRVSFGGNSLTDRETVENYLLYRAAELTLEQGFDHFIFAERYTDEETRRRVTGRNLFLDHRSRFHYSFFHPRWGWRGGYDPFWDDMNHRQISRYEASAEILLGHGPKPSSEAAFDARDVMTNLGDHIVRPSPND